MVDAFELIRLERKLTRLSSRYLFVNSVSKIRFQLQFSSDPKMSTRDISLPMTVNEVQNAVAVNQSNENHLSEGENSTKRFSQQWRDAKAEGCSGIITFLIAW